jgi:adenosylcobinamide-phosphate synthase
MFFGAAALALFIEQFTGYPKTLYKLAGHPVEWLGKLIGWADLAINREGAPKLEGRLRGIAGFAAVLGGALAAAIPLALVARSLPLGWAIEALLAVPLIAQRSMYQHVAAVIKAFDYSIDYARIAVGMIVGRETGELDEAGVSRAAVESLAENTSDGIVAPVFWFVLLGLPGIAAYKAVNTLDSMIGHRSERYLHFGWASARIDDLVNLPASRLTGFLFALAAGPRRMRESWNAMIRDAGKHQSPNAGWPEAAMAGALAVRLGGPRAYDGHIVELAAMGRGRAELTRDDVRKALKLYGRAMTLLLALVLVCAWLF